MHLSIYPSSKGSREREETKKISSNLLFHLRRHPHFPILLQPNLIILQILLATFLLQLRRRQRLKHMRLPLPDRNAFEEKSLQLRIRPPRRLSDTKPRIRKRNQRRTRIHKPDHGPQFRIIIQIRTRKHHQPHGKKERPQRARSNFIPISPHCHFRRNRIRQCSNGEVVKNDIEVCKHDNSDTDSSGEISFRIFCDAETADGDERDEHSCGADEEVGAPVDFVAENYGAADGEDLDDVDYCVDGEGFAYADGLREDDAVGVPELDAVDLE